MGDSSLNEVDLEGLKIDSFPCSQSNYSFEWFLSSSWPSSWDPGDVYDMSIYDQWSSPKFRLENNDVDSNDYAPIVVCVSYDDGATKTMLRCVDFIGYGNSEGSNYSDKL